jgi:hypothetical protein
MLTITVLAILFTMCSVWTYHQLSMHIRGLTGNARPGTRLTVVPKHPGASNGMALMVVVGRGLWGYKSELCLHAVQCMLEA